MSRWPPTHNYGSGQNKFESQFHQCATAMGWASPNEAINEDSDGANTVNPSPATLIPGLQCQVPQCPSESYQMNQQANLVAQYNHLGYAQVPVPVGYTNTGQHAVNPGYANEMVTAGSRSSMFIPMGSPSSGSPAGMSTFNQPNQPLVSHSSHVSDSNGTLVMTSPAVDSTPQSIHDRRHVSEHDIQDRNSPIQSSWTDCTENPTFAQEGSLWRHIKTKHICPERFVCPSCGRRFHRADNLRTHRHVHMDM